MDHHRHPAQGAIDLPIPPQPLDCGGVTIARARGPADLAAVIPYLLGFEPVESLVVVSLVGPSRRLGPLLRVDLPDEGDDEGRGELIERVGALVGIHRWDPVLVVAYTEHSAAADLVVEALLRRLADDDVVVDEAMAASRRRWWSYTCGEPCCPAGGTPFDPAASPLAAAAVVAGLAKAGDRDAVREMVAPAPGAVRDEVGRLSTAFAEQASSGASPWRDGGVVAAVEAAVGREDLPPVVLARLLAMAQDHQMRDAAWGALTRKRALGHARVWQQVARAAPDAVMAPPGALAGFAWWLAGFGVVASHAADRVAEVSPANPLNELLRRLLAAGVDPQSWDRR